MRSMPFSISTWAVLHLVIAPSLLWGAAEPESLAQEASQPAVHVPAEGPVGLADEGSSSPADHADVVAQALAERGGVRSVGPDVIVGDIYKEPAEPFGLRRYGRVGSISAYAVGTISCNPGTAPINWISSNNQHPVIGSHLYRLKDGRMEQIGMSWLKHAFLALCQSTCFNDCQCDFDGNSLGVHCSDPYNSNLNGTQSNLGPRNQVNAATGAYPYPWTAPGFPATIGRRLQVQDADIHPPLNSGALYFLEGEYVTSDDALAGNNRNNSSYRRVQVVWSGGASTTYNIDFVAGHGTQRERPGLLAWQDVDPAVQMATVDVASDGRVILGSKATDLGGGTWHYEYALYNMNSDRSVGGFTVPIPPGTTVTNIGFRDVTYHSHGTSNQSFYDGTDWPGSASSCSVSWQTTAFGVNQNANAVRWGTTYNYRFDANVPPGDVKITLGLFKPGTPASVLISAQGPRAPGITDCNSNGHDDPQDIACGFSQDCDLNSTPDECQPDCDADGTPDACEILGGASDCDLDGVPDSCEIAANDCNNNGTLDGCDVAAGAPDCNSNGRPDTCDLAGQDCNNNGTPDSCELAAQDCNGNGTVDSCDIAGGAPDCNGNGRPDSCDLSGADCNTNGTPDSCELAGNDCNGNGTVDSCDIADGAPDCNGNGRPDSCDLGLNDCDSNGTPDSCDVSGGAADCNSNGRPDACDLGPNDCDTNGTPDSCDVAGGAVDCNSNGRPDSCDLGLNDCDTNGTPDSCDVASGASDCNSNGRPDSCDLGLNDCDTNGIPDSCDVAGGAADCNGNGRPDGCDLSGNDCNTNGLPDECELAGADCDSNGIPDLCQLTGNDCNSNGTPDHCELPLHDCNGNGTVDACDLAAGAPDCNSNGRPDSCDLGANDCDTNGTPDACDVAGGSPDCNGNGRPDSCEVGGNDCNTNGRPDECDLAGADCNSNGVPDACELAGNDCQPNGVIDACDIFVGVSEDVDSNGIPDECLPPIPNATVTGAVSRKACDLTLMPSVKTEPRVGGVALVRIGFDMPPGDPPGSAAGITLEWKTCAAPMYVPYGGASTATGFVSGNELVLSFSPGLENPATFRINLGPTVTGIAGQSVQVRGLTGDVNNDGHVDALDRSVVVGVWTSSGFDCLTDVSGEGATDALDRSIVVGAWTGGANCAP